MAVVGIPLFLLLCGLLSYFPGRPPRPAGADSDPARFSAVRAAEILKTIAVRPHPIGSQDHERVRKVLEERLRSLAEEVTIQRAEVVSDYQRRGGTVVMARVENLLARVRGTDSRGAVLLMSHYDSAPCSPGAADDGAGVAAILETLRALSVGPPLRNDLIVLLSDGEEAGLLGAQAFFREHTWRDEVRLVVNLEARGSGGPALMFETSAGNGRLIREFVESVPHPMADSLAYEIYRRMPNDTDLSIAKRFGAAGLNVAFTEGLYDYHSAGDSLAHLSLASLQQTGEYALGLSRRFGNLDLEDLAAPDAVFFNPIDSWLLILSPWLNWVALGVFVLLFAWALRRGARAGTTGIVSVALGAGAFLAILVLTGETSAFLHILIRRWAAPEGLADWKLLLSERWLLIGQACLAVALFALLYGWLGRGIRGWQALAVAIVPGIAFVGVGTMRWELPVLNAVLALLLFAGFRRGVQRAWSPAIGALGVCALGFGLLTIFLPGGAFLLGWPLLFALPVQTWAVGFRPGTSIRAAWPVLLCGGLPGGILLADLAYRVQVNLASLLPWIAVIPIGLLLGLVIPLFTATERRSLLGLTAISGMLALAFLSAPLVSNFDTRHPRPAELFYLVGPDDGGGSWATTDRSLSPWQEQVIGVPTRVSLDRIVPGQRGRLVLSPPHPVEVGSPEIEPVSAFETEQGARIEFRILPSPGAARLMLFFSGLQQVVAADVDGMPLPVTPGPQGTWRWLHSAPPPEGLRVRLEGKELDAASLRVIQFTYGWPSTLKVPERPPTLMSNPRGLADSTVVVREWPLSEVAAGPAPAP